MGDQPEKLHADPWADTDVIDERAPRANQSVVAVVALLGVVFGWPLAWALMGAQLGIGLVFGRQYCLPCLAYFKLIQPIIGEGELEDARPPRLANQMGFVFLTGAATAWWLGAEGLGTGLGIMVAALATLAATTGFCAGCELYKLVAKVRGISPEHHSHLDPADFALNGAAGAERAYVQFTHPLCSDCHRWEAELSGRPEPSVRVDVRERPDLAEKYGIAIVPTVVAIAPDGTVVERLAP